MGGHRSIAEPFWLEQLREDEGEEEEEVSEEPASSTDQTDGNQLPPCKTPGKMPAKKRLDPKVILKVEGIFIKYISYALVPGGVATLLGIPSYRLLFNMMLSCFLLAYAVYQYRRRMSELNNGKPGANMADTSHSWVLTCCAVLFTFSLYPWGVEHSRKLFLGYGA